MPKGSLMCEPCLGEDRDRKSRWGTAILSLHKRDMVLLDGKDFASIKTKSHRVARSVETRLK